MSNLQHQGLMDGGTVLTGDAFIEWCKIRGLCDKCGQTQVFQRGKLGRKGKPLTKTNTRGDFEVYKGYCLSPTCHTLDEVRRILGETSTSPASTPKGQKRISLTAANSPHNNMPISGRSGRAHLDFSRSNASVQQKCDNIRVCNTLKTLILDYSSLDDAGLQLILEALRPHVGLQVLSLSHNRFGRNGIRSLAQFLPTCTALSELRLVGNSLADDSMSILAPALAKIANIDLSHNRIGKHGGRAIGRALRETTQIQSLELDDNQLTDDGVKAIAQGILQSHKNSCLSVLSLQKNQFGDKAVLDIALLLPVAKVLTELALDDNEFTNKGLSAICNALVSNTTLRYLTGLQNGHTTDAGLITRIQTMLNMNRSQTRGRSSKNAVAHVIRKPQRLSNFLPSDSHRGNDMAESSRALVGDTMDSDDEESDKADPQPQSPRDPKPQSPKTPRSRRGSDSDRGLKRTNAQRLSIALQQEESKEESSLFAKLGASFSAFDEGSPTANVKPRMGASLSSFDVSDLPDDPRLAGPEILSRRSSLEESDLLEASDYTASRVSQKFGEDSLTSFDISGVPEDSGQSTRASWSRHESRDSSDMDQATSRGGESFSSFDIADIPDDRQHTRRSVQARNDNRSLDLDHRGMQERQRMENSATTFDPALIPGESRRRIDNPLSSDLGNSCPDFGSEQLQSLSPLHNSTDFGPSDSPISQRRRPGGTAAPSQSEYKHYVQPLSQEPGLSGRDGRQKSHRSPPLRNGKSGRLMGAGGPSFGESSSSMDQTRTFNDSQNIDMPSASDLGQSFSSFGEEQDVSFAHFHDSAASKRSDGVAPVQSRMRHAQSVRESDWRQSRQRQDAPEQQRRFSDAPEGMTPDYARPYVGERATGRPPTEEEQRIPMAKKNSSSVPANLNSIMPMSQQPKMQPPADRRQLQDRRLEQGSAEPIPSQDEEVMVAAARNHIGWDPSAPFSRNENQGSNVGAAGSVPDLAAGLQRGEPPRSQGGQSPGPANAVNISQQSMPSHFHNQQAPSSSVHPSRVSHMDEQHRLHRVSPRRPSGGAQMRRDESSQGRPQRATSYISGLPQSAPSFTPQRTEVYNPGQPRHSSQAEAPQDESHMTNRAQNEFQQRVRFANHHYSAPNATSNGIRPGAVSVSLSGPSPGMSMGGDAEGVPQELLDQFAREDRASQPHPSRVDADIPRELLEQFAREDQAGNLHPAQNNADEVPAELLLQFQREDQAAQTRDVSVVETRSQSTEEIPLELLQKFDREDNIDIEQFQMQKDGLRQRPQYDDEIPPELLDERFLQQATATAYASRPNVSGGGDSHQTWKCSTCTYVNDNPLHLTCKMCGTRKNAEGRRHTIQDFRQLSFRSAQKMMVRTSLIDPDEEEIKAIRDEHMRELLDMQHDLMADYDQK